MNHIGDGNKMVETPRTDDEELRQTQRFGVSMVKAGFSRQLERELQQWKEYAQRLESAGDKLAEWHLLVPTTHPQAKEHVAAWNAVNKEAKR
jgi:hypothetical protein